MADNNWKTPTLKEVRTLNKEYVTGELDTTFLPRDVPVVLCEANAGNAHLAYQYLDYLSEQLLPDTATGVYLDKWANIYLINSDGSRGRKISTYASGTISITAVSAGTIIPAGSQLNCFAGSTQLVYETVQASAISTSATTVQVRSLLPGAASNLAPGTTLALQDAIQGIAAASATVISLTGGADAESDDEVRARLLKRVANPPMGGSANDWETWALSVPGVTRAWCASNEVCAGTVTLRIRGDDLRASDDPMTSGLPTSADLQAVRDYIETVRSVTVAQFWVLAPVPEAVNLRMNYLNKDTISTRTAIATSISKMIKACARPSQSISGVIAPAQTIYRLWVSDAIYSSAGVKSATVDMDDFVPSGPSRIAVLGSIVYD